MASKVELIKELSEMIIEGTATPESMAQLFDLSVGYTTVTLEGIVHATESAGACPLMHPRYEKQALALHNACAGYIRLYNQEKL